MENLNREKGATLGPSPKFPQLTPTPASLPPKD